MMLRIVSRLLLLCVVVVAVAIGIRRTLAPADGLLVALQGQRLMIDPDTDRVFHIHAPVRGNLEALDVQTPDSRTTFQLKWREDYMAYRLNSLPQEQLIAEDVWKSLAISPDGKYLYFALDAGGGSANLMVYNIETETITPLLTIVSLLNCPSQMPEWCVFTTTIDGNHTLYLLETRTQQISVLGIGSIPFYFQYHWYNGDTLYYNVPASLASSQMVYRHDPTTDETQPVVRLDGVLPQSFRFSVDKQWFVASAGNSFSTARWFVVNASPDDDRQFQVLDDSFNFHGDYKWSPTEPRLLFAAADFPGQRPWNLYVADFPSAEVQRLSHLDRGFAYVDYIWSPDGTEIAYAVVERANGKTISHLFRMPVGKEAQLYHSWSEQIEGITWVEDVANLGR